MSSNSKVTWKNK